MFHTVLILGCLLTPTMIPSLGVSALFCLVVASQWMLGQAPSRRHTMAGLVSTLPTPLAACAPLMAPHPWWQRLVLCGALVLVWAPIRPEVQWISVLIVAGVSFVYPQQRDAWRWFVPWLHLAALRAWPMWWDIGVVITSVIIMVVALWVQRNAVVRWAGVMVLLALNTGAGLAVVPWAMVVASVSAPWLSVIVIWAAMSAFVAAGASFAVVIGLGMLVWISTRLSWPISWRIVAVWLMWALVPITATEARLQSSLSAYGRLWSDGALTMVTAGQQAVTIIPWMTFVATMVVLGSIVVQWKSEQRHVE